ncbi:MAG TPA: hypothetical protein DEB40_04885 [Elusimicrobia bacterium]|nr:hypothetical protein [Elusimicrobiota bacterium]
MTQLPKLTPLDATRRLQELAATDPAMRNLAAAVVEPSLIELHRAQLEAKLGQEQVSALTELAVNLQIEARGDERVMAGLEALARQIAPAGQVPDFDRFYDGDAAPDAPAAADPETAPLAPALTWPVEEDSSYKRRVHAITSQNGRILINGKPAKMFRDREVKDGVTKEIYIHPDDPGLLVKIYNSPASLEGFERKNAKIEALGPLSAAGGAPKLIEHGEAPVQGKGLVYFYVEELVKGAKLLDLLIDNKPLEEVKKLFQRLIKAGLALLVPGPDQHWLLSHIMIGQTPSGGFRAYILGGTPERATAEELAAHYEMLLAVLYPGPAEQKREAGGIAPPALSMDSLMRPPKLGTSPEDADIKAILITPALPDSLDSILKRHKLENASRDAATLRFESPQAAATAASDLLADEEVAQIKVHPAVKDYVERRGARALAEILKLLPISQKRNALILKIPALAYAKTESADVAEILALIGPEEGKTPEIFAKVPASAWQKLDRGDIQSLIKRWVAVDYKATSAAIMRSWINAREEHLVKTEAELTSLGEMIKLLPESDARDTAILNIPASAYAQMESAQVAEILGLVRSDEKSTPKEVYGKIPEPVWQKLDGQNVQGLMKKWVKIDYLNTASAIMRSWMNAREDYLGKTEAELTSLGEMIKLLPESDARDTAILDIPASVYARMGSAQIAEILGLVRAGEKAAPKEVYGKIPEPVWQKLDGQDVQGLMKKWVKIDYLKTASVIMRSWMNAREDYLGKTKVELKGLGEMIGLIRESETRDAAILQIPASLYARMQSADAAEILALVSLEAEKTAGAIYNKVPQSAWQQLDGQDVPGLVKKWVAAGYAGTASVIIQLWTNAREEYLGKTKTAQKNLGEMIKLLPSSSAAAILKIPASVYAQMESAQIAEILALVTPEAEKTAGATYDKVPQSAWQNLSRQEVQSLIKRWLAVDYKGTASAIMQLWVNARKEQPGKTEAELKNLAEMIKLLPESNSRDTAILKITASVFAQMESAEAAAILALASLEAEKNAGTIYNKVPRSVWQKLDVQAVQSLIKQWLAARYSETAFVIMQLWMNAHQEQTGTEEAELKGLGEIIALLPASAARNGVILTIPVSAYASMESAEAAAILDLVHPDGNTDPADVYRKIPEPVWQKLDGQAVRGLVKKWTQANREGPAFVIVQSWMNARQDYLGKTEAELKTLVEMIKLIPECSTRDAVILKIPAAVYAQMKSADVAAILALVRAKNDVETAGSYRNIPEPVWRRLEAPDIQGLIKKWATARYAATSSIIMQLWMNSRQEQPGKTEAELKSLGEIIKLIPESTARNTVILAIPVSAYAQMESAETAAILDLVWPDGNTDPAEIYRKIPEPVWQRLDGRDVPGLIEKWVTAGRVEPASVIAQSWINARQDYLVKTDTDIKNLVETIRLIPESPARDRAILNIPASVYAQMNSADVAAAMALVHYDPKELYSKIPKPVWRRMDGQDAQNLIKRWTVAGFAGVASLLMQFWIDSNQDRLGQAGATGEDLCEMAASLLLRQDSWWGVVLATKISISAYAAMESRTIARLFHHSAPNAYEKFPKEAWLKMRLRDADWLIEQWTAAKQENMPDFIKTLWKAARQGNSGESTVKGKDLYATLSVLPRSAQRDELILKIRGVEFEAMESADIAAILRLVNPDANPDKMAAIFSRIPEEAWYRMNREDMELLTKYWAEYDPTAAASIAQLWIKARQ